MKRKAIDYKKRLQNQNIIITALVIIILVLVAVSSTAAWYITTRTDTVDIVLGKAVNPYITSFKEIVGEDGKLYQVHSTTQKLLEGNTRVYPGDQLTMQLGFQLGKSDNESSPAYVRVKLTVLYENIYTGESGKIEDLNKDFGREDNDLNSEDSDALIEYNSSIASGATEDERGAWQWAPVNFNQDEKDEQGKALPADNWYVLQNTSSKSARIVRTDEQYAFIDGTIELSELNITNKYANCKFHIQYTVEAIQVVNVQDPIEERNRTQEERTNPWWTDVDIYFDEEE